MTPEWERAVGAGDMEALARQLDAGIDVDALDRHGENALMIAATLGDSATVGWLIDHGAELDHTAKYGLSALMLAVVNGRHDVVRRLVAAGADLTLRGGGATGFAGLTAHDLAVKRGDEGLAPLCLGDAAP